MRRLGRICSALLRRNLRREIEDEIQLHIELQARKYMRSGLSEDEAHRQAYIAFGGTAHVIEECREERGIRFLESSLHDCQYAFRSLRRSPAFALTVVLTVALGVGANSTVFAFCKAMLLATLPVPNPHQLHLVTIGLPDGTSETHFSFPDLQQMAKRAARAAALTGFTEVVDYHLQNDSGTSSTLKGQLVAGNFFSVLQVSPFAGRVFGEGPSVPEQGAVAVLSYRYWAQRLGSDASVVGKRLLIQRKPVTVLGVMPRGFDGVEPGVRPDIWMPLSVQAAIGYGGYASLNAVDGNKPWLLQDVSWLHVLARSNGDRMDKGLSAALTQWLKTEVAALLPRVTDARERTMILNARMLLTSAARGLPRLRTQFSLPLRILLGLVAVLLFSGCVNILNLLFARSRAHVHEAAIRVALGSSRMRVIANRLTETLLLVLAGGILSVPLAVWGSQAILHWLVVRGDLQIDIAPDWGMLAFTGGITLLTAVAVGLLPARRTADLANSGSLGYRTQTSAVATRRASRWSFGFVAAQMALSLTSLVIAGLLTHTLLNYERLEIGMDRQRVLSVGIDPSAAGYDNGRALDALYRELTTAIDRIPAVVSSSVAGCGLMDNGCATVAATVEGAEEKRSESLVERNYVGPHYFATVGMNLIRGRAIADSDTLNSIPVGVVNVEFEREFLNGRSALGRLAHVEAHAVRIVGVVKDARSDNIHKRALAYIFLPVEQAPGGWNVSHIEIRTQGNPEAVAGPVRSAILGINRAIPISEITTLSEEVNSGLSSELLVGRLAGLFSALTLIIAAIGLYGVLAYETALRRSEFAVRLALGATPGDIVSKVLRRALLICTAGSAGGLLLCIPVVRLIKSLLFETGSLDAWTYVGSLLALLVFSTIAVFLPAQSAACVDPASTLRSE